MAHMDGDIALKAEEKARTSACQHPRVVEMRREPLRTQIQAWREAGGTFAGNADVTYLADLRTYLVELRMAPHNSRYVEAEHAKIQVGLRRANRHNDAYVSLLRRMPALIK
eukprot:5310469-Heterocapsa_arctica.AAC.1